MKRIGIACVATIFVLNLVALLLIKFLDGPSPYFARLEPSLKTQTMKDYIRTNGPPTLVTIGSSIADMGFDVLDLEHRLSKKGIQAPGFNFGVNGAGSVVFRELLSRVIIPLARPKMIIYGTSAIEFNRSSSIFLEDQRKFLASAGLSIVREGPTFAAVSKAALFPVLPSYQLGELLWPSAFLEATNTTWLGVRGFKAEFRGQQRLKGTWGDAMREGWPEWATVRYKNLLFDYKVSEDSMATLRDIADLCRRHDIELVIVNMPVMLRPPELAGSVFWEIEQQNGQGAIQATYEEALRNMVGALQVRFLDIGASNNYPADFFRDPYHLNEKGATELAREIASRLF